MPGDQQERYCQTAGRRVDPQPARLRDLPPSPANRGSAIGGPISALENRDSPCSRREWTYGSANARQARNVPLSSTVESPFPRFSARSDPKPGRRRASAKHPHGPLRFARCNCAESTAGNPYRYRALRFDSIEHALFGRRPSRLPQQPSLTLPARFALCSLRFARARAGIPHPASPPQTGHAAPANETTRNCGDRSPSKHHEIRLPSHS
jgi:hypothetical protein